jgi:D-alanyl-D-alanine carboxypeptidase (penicillin-binding protein 5/6)
VGIQTKELEAPVTKGSQIGVLQVYVQEQLVKEVPLLAAEDVARGSWYQILWDNLRRFFNNLIRRR